MNTQTNAMPESSLGSQAITPSTISATRHMHWALQREFWESRFIYLAPLAVAALFLFGFAIRIVHLPREMRAAAALDAMKQRETIAQPYDMAAALLMGTFLIVGMFYCVE